MHLTFSLLYDINKFIIYKTFEKKKKNCEGFYLVLLEQVNII